MMMTMIIMAVGGGGKKKKVKVLGSDRLGGRIIFLARRCVCASAAQTGVGEVERAQKDERRAAN